MSFEFRTKDQGAVHFVTFTVHQWVDVFTRDIYREELIKNLKYCQANRGLEIFAWALMSNHCHLILRAKNEDLSDIIRDFKKFISKKILKLIIDNPQESRKSWMVNLLTVGDRIWFWEEGYHGEEVYSKKFFETVNYIHMNPVRAGWVEKEEDYIWSSALGYFGIKKGKLELTEFG
ncbi:transposase [Algoriphagus sp. D3-2-R+10]|uniref:REP-associated tyrosine transposase n=1 Tax=Algoriphagus aurantiacus TaxID=3103948 RepID=UPI002B3DFEDE|nr:transposase [Algoriphagus sp. D3-2-R+10]MEB2778451.1 transposase [Algoriphagus sp. D3-2-R+10]